MTEVEMMEMWCEGRMWRGWRCGMEGVRYWECSVELEGIRVMRGTLAGVECGQWKGE